jgi:hypothetical protein
MIHNVWGRLPQGFRSRPFDAYTAISLIVVGVYAILDPVFPEGQTDAFGELIFNVISLYFIAASLVMLAALFCQEKKHPTFAYFGQMYAWAFIAAAGMAAATYQLWSGIISQSVTVDNPALFWVVFFIWGAIGWAAFVRAFDMWTNLRLTKRMLG